MIKLLALLLLFVASSAYGQPVGGGTGGGNINYLSQIKIDTCSDGNVIAYAESTSEWVCSAAGGGSGAILDLGDDGGNDSTGIGEIATVNDANGVFIMSAADKLLIDLSANWPSADTADALSANAANCSAGQIPLGVDETGAVEGCYTAPAAAILDLADNGVNESSAIGEIATTGDTNSIFTESADDKLLINLGLNWPTADAADALSANGGNCSANQIALGVDTVGAAEGCYALPMTILDLGDAGANQSANITEIATTGDTNSIFTESAADKLLIDLTKKWPAATAADGLAANGGNCSANEIPLGVTAAGAAEGCYALPMTLLDIGDDGGNDSANITEIATTGDTNSVITESADNKLLINFGLNWPAADTADALSANGSNCPEGEVPIGVDASGAVEGCVALTPGAASLLDLGDDGVNESDAIGEIAVTGDTNSIFTEPAGNKLLIDLALNWPVADEAVELVDNGANCEAGQVPLGVDTFGAVEGCYFPDAGTPATLTAADTTPEVSVGQVYYECSDETIITDFVDSDGDHSEFSEFWIHIAAVAGCSLDFTGPMRGNKEALWAAEIGDTATCYFSTGNDEWSCFVSDPDSAGAFDQESATIVAPATATTEWTRVCGAAGCVAVGSTDGTTMEFDLDNDQAADCTLTKSEGVSTFSCGNANFSATPGQAGGDIIFNQPDGDPCLTLDPDTGTITQSAGCGTVHFDYFVTSRVVHDTEAQATRTLSGAHCHGYLWKANHSVLERFTLCNAEDFGGQLVCFEDWSGNGITVDVADTETMRLADGTVLTGGNSIDLEPGIGHSMCVFSDSNTAWHVMPGAIGAIADGGT